jgi:hypothetical protein
MYAFKIAVLLTEFTQTTTATTTTTTVYNQTLVVVDW